MNNISLIDQSSNKIIQETSNIFQKQKLIDPKHRELEIGKQIESLFLQILLKASESDLFKNNFFHSESEQMYSDLHHQIISQNVSSKGIGLAEFIEKQLLILKSHDHDIDE